MIFTKEALMFLSLYASPRDSIVHLPLDRRGFLPYLMEEESPPVSRMKRFLFRLVVTCVLLLPSAALSQGTVYLVLGSDTGIWEGMDVGRYACTYTLGLFTDPSRNAARVMDPAFRSGLLDSYGTPVKLTWWMMAGNIFRHATNTDVPHPNTMTLFLMKKYDGAAIRRWGDELTLHYHTFVWTDYDGDGKWYWNQAKEFTESADDFDETLAEMLLDEEVFPVSFRSGWHAMDNPWQQRLDSLLPYSLHNDWPAKRADPTEPIDNVYDWSRATSAFVPFHPSLTDYQISGAGRGWNVRSTYMSGADSTFMAKIFAEAAKGTDQVVCLWAHLPETDFLDNIRKVDASAHRAAAAFPAVRYRYCTAVEAMQAWRRTADTTRPIVTLEESGAGTAIRWTVRSDEPLFQPEPVVAVKDRYEQYRMIPCVRQGDRQWQTAVAVPRDDVARVGVAATDTAGNSTITILRYLPDEVFVDDEDTSRVSATGSWTVSQTPAWGRTSRIATLHTGETASFRWTPSLTHSARYNIFIQIPAVSTAARSCVFRFLRDATVVDSVSFSQPLNPGSWVYLGSRFLGPIDQHTLELAASGTGQDGLHLAADVVKYSPLIRNRWLVVPPNLDAGEIVAQESNRRSIVLQNQGIEPVTISRISSQSRITSVEEPFPVMVPPMGNRTITIQLLAMNAGPLVDTLRITSDDPRHLLTQITVTGIARDYFVVVDDRDSLAYLETGSWSFSVAQAYGSTSRYAYPAVGVSATFTVRPKKSGLYEVLSIVPTTVNASLRARYLLVVNGTPVDSVFLDQNAGSGSWVSLLRHTLAADADVRIVITDAMATPSSGKVLRADAIRFQWLPDGTTAVTGGGPDFPTLYALTQNFPNPFNPTTTITYQIPKANLSFGTSDPGFVSLIVYDVLGREVATLVNERKGPGVYMATFDASGLASGVYLYRLAAGSPSTGTGNSFVQSRRMLLIR